MNEETETLTLHLLREIRRDMQEMRTELKTEMREVHQRIDGVAHILTLRAGQTYRQDDRMDDFERRLARLEQRGTPTA